MALVEKNVSTKSDLLQLIEREWEALNAFLDELTDSQWSIHNTDGWSAKDHVAHLTAWERSVIALLTRTPRHEGLGIPESLYLSEDVNAMNAAIFEQHKDVPLEAVRQNFTDTHQELMAVVNLLTNADLSLPYAHYLPDEPGEEEGLPAINIIYGNTAHHFRQHLISMQETLERRRYMKKHRFDYSMMWNLGQGKLIAETPTSNVYESDLLGRLPVVLKIFTPRGLQDEASGVLALQHFRGEGAVMPYYHHREALVMEYADGGDLLAMVRRGDDEEATRVMAGLLNRLHQKTPPATPGGLVTLERRFRSLFQYAESGEAEPIFVRGAEIARALLDDPQEVRVLHGDMHHQNVLYATDRQQWLAIDPKGLYGERTFDACNILCNPLDMPELVHDEGRLLRHAQILTDEMRLEWQRLLRFTFAYACLSVVWSREDGQDGSYTLRIAEMLRVHTA